MHTNINMISYDCESPIYFSNYSYCTFLVQLIRFVGNLYNFQPKFVTLIYLIKVLLISSFFALFEMVILY